MFRLLFKVILLLNLLDKIQAKCLIRRYRSERSKRSEYTDPNIVESHLLTPFSTDNLWPNATVYYRFDTGYFTPDAQVFITNAMRHLEQLTCVRFAPVPDNFQSTHLYFTNGQFCSSYVGRQSGLITQDLTLPPQCIKERGAIHEIIHALGFGHEQTRGDRDDYVQVNWNNIPNPYWFTFEEDRDGHFLMKYAVPYDYLSIMHYGPFDFAINKNLPTLVSTNNYFNVPVNQELSALDVIKINMLYNCQTNLRKHVDQCIDLFKECYGVPIENCRTWPYLTYVCRQRCNMCQ